MDRISGIRTGKMFYLPDSISKDLLLNRFWEEYIRIFIIDIEEDDFYILYSGKVHISRKTPAGDEIALADLSHEMNIFFGETALISDDPRTATVKALTDCKCIALSSTKFLEVCDKEPLLGYRVLLKLAQRMAKTIRDTNSDKATLYEALFSEIESGV